MDEGDVGMTGEQHVAAAARIRGIFIFGKGEWVAVLVVYISIV